MPPFRWNLRYVLHCEAPWGLNWSVWTLQIFVKYGDYAWIHQISQLRCHFWCLEQKIPTFIECLTVEYSWLWVCTSWELNTFWQWNFSQKGKMIQAGCLHRVHNPTPESMGMVPWDCSAQVSLSHGRDGDSGCNTLLGDAWRIKPDLILRTKPRPRLEQLAWESTNLDVGLGLGPRPFPFLCDVGWRSPLWTLRPQWTLKTAPGTHHLVASPLLSVHLKTGLSRTLLKGKPGDLLPSSQHFGQTCEIRNQGKGPASILSPKEGVEAWLNAVDKNRD